MEYGNAPREPANLLRMYCEDSFMLLPIGRGSLTNGRMVYRASQYLLIEVSDPVNYNTLFEDIHLCSELWRIRGFKKAEGVTEALCS